MLLLLIVVIASVAFAVYVGLMVLLRAEVQNAVDAGALAAAIQLQHNPRDLTAAEDAARRFVQLNRAGTAVRIPEGYIDIERGEFEPESGTFQLANNKPNAIRVFARQENERFVFARIFGQDRFGAPASAIAASQSNPMDIMLVLDLSGSMADEGRIQALWTAAPHFITVIERLQDDDRIGVMGLATDPGDRWPIRAGRRAPLYNSGLHPTDDHYVGVLESPLTDDFRGLRGTILAKTNLIPGKYTGWTGTGAALGDAAHYLKNGAEGRDDVDKAIVLMSDGHANRPSRNASGYALSMAEYAAGHDIKVYTISLGNEADVPLMEEIAELGNGQHFDATGAGVEELTERLTGAFERAAASLKRVQLVK
jgi:Mg-chelatase subunit ChlD